MTKSTQSIETILSKACGEHLPRLIQRAQRLNDISCHLSLHLGQPLGQHVKVANIRGNTVILLIDSPAWLSKLRYISPAVVKYLKDYGVSAVELQVDPERKTSPLPSPRPAASLSRASAELITSTAETTADPGLAKALQRLARHAK
ncbi:MAG: hypothetical protein A2V90_03570 [Gammaproteobacteria bacterium RBG_16_57_12]|nr:MAG: hypothetical protein A2V90_03570 [Gammaproteobacteria bacterium RBG_16_57_12]